jgi:hypothetical protein
MNIKQLLRAIKFKPKVKITFVEDLRHYRYDIHCPNCGKFKGKNHKCNLLPRERNGKYRCGICLQYLPYKEFQKDCTKRFGINTRCKECRSLTGNGNKTTRQAKVEWY